MDESPGWIKNKKVAINSKKKDNTCFQYVVTVALNQGENKPHSARVCNIKPFINKYNWNGIRYLSKTNDQKKFKKNNPTIAPNLLYTK